MKVKITNKNYNLIYNYQEKLDFNKLFSNLANEDKLDVPEALTTKLLETISSITPKIPFKVRVQNKFRSIYSTLHASVYNKRIVLKLLYLKRFNVIIILSLFTFITLSTTNSNEARETIISKSTTTNFYNLGITEKIIYNKT